MSMSMSVSVSVKTVRRAIARLGERGTLTPERQGWHVRWHLTDHGRELLESGVRRIYEFGSLAEQCSGEWLIAHFAIPEARPATRVRVRTNLTFNGFGELSPTLAVSPHVDREDAVRAIILGLGVEGAVVWRGVRITR
jgi:phenylacetic acid degradation operon negative regulatory protein